MIADAKIINEHRAQDHTFPLTSTQMPYWLAQLFFPGKPIANIGIRVILEGAIDTSLFAEAIRRVVQETDALRLRFKMENHKIRQELLDLPDYAIEQFDFSDEPDGDAIVQQWIENQFWAPMDWAAFPLFRFALLKIRHDRYVWILKYNHLVNDAIGRNLLVRRIAEIYDTTRMAAVPPPSEGASIAELVTADESYRNSEKYLEDRNYWLERFSTLPDRLVQGDRRETERAKSGRATRISFEISRRDFESLETMARSLGSSAPRALLTLTYIAFSRLYGVSDLVLGFALHNRTTRKLKQTIGLFSQILPLRVALDAKASFADALRQLDAFLVKDRVHNQFPPVELVSMLQLGQYGRSLYDVLVNYTPPASPVSFGGVTAKISNLSYGFFLPWTITASDLGQQSGVKLSVDYDPGVIDGDEARRLAKCLNILLTNGIADVHQPISSLSLIDDEERNRLVVDFNRSYVSIPTNATLTQLCAEQARRTPHATAVISGNQQIDFATLHSRAESLASTLVTMGVRSETVVGIALPRTIDLVVAALAIHKAGGAYLPIDPADAERILYIVNDSRASIIVTNSAIAAALPEMSAPMLLLDRLDRDSFRSKTELPVVQPHHLAYVLYTSGSTGLPKGVCVEHRNVANLILCMRSMIDLEDLGGVLFLTSFNFDISAYELFLPLIYGGRMIIVENIIDIKNAPARDEVRLINTAPSLIDALLKLGAFPKNTRTVNLAGESLSRALADRIFAAVPGVRLMNLYGPTETTVYSSWSRVDRSDRRPPAIGRPIWNTQLYVLDSCLGLLPQGATGELYIGGAGVSRGYLDRPELTQERFLRNLFGEGFFYRTGDLVRWRADGELEFLGRADNQIKIHGQRVELGEVEKQIEALPGVAAAAAVARPNKSGANALHAYVIAKDERSASEMSDITGQLSRKLPRYMLPSTVTWLRSFPLTPSGKLDRRALPTPEKTGVNNAYRAPSDEIEALLTEIWEEVLDIKRVGVDDDFYDLGGNSLQALDIFCRIAAAVGVDLSSASMMHGSTIARQAELLRKDERFDTSTKLVAFRRGGSKAPLFVVHGGYGGIMFVRELERHLQSDRPVFGLRPPSLDGTGLLHYTVESIAADYIAEVRKEQARGPYFIAGYSFGGCVAFEMAQQLVRAGERVAFLGMIDASIRNESAFSRTRQAIVSHPGMFVRKATTYLANRISGAARQLPNYVRVCFGLSIRYPERHAYYWHVYTRAARRYSARPYSGHVIVFAASAMMELHYARWRPLALGGVTMREIRADHSEIVRPPYSSLLAESFDSIIDIAS